VLRKAERDVAEGLKDPVGRVIVGRTRAGDKEHRGGTIVFRKGVDRVQLVLAALQKKVSFCDVAVALLVERIRKADILMHSRDLHILHVDRHVDVRALGCLQAIEVVKDRETKEPFVDAGKMIYQRAFNKGLAWVPSGHILRMSPPMILDDDAALKGLDIIEEAVKETEQYFGY